MADTIALDPAAPSLAQSIGGWQGITKNALEIQDAQAKQAAGQAYQGAINPLTGEFDPNEFRRRLAASGPAAMAAGAALTNTQQISSDQLRQNMTKAGWVNSRAGAALQSGDFSDAGMLRIFHDGLASGVLTMPEVMKQMQGMPPDAEGRKRWLQEHQDTAATFQEQMDQRYGKPITVNQGGAVTGGMQQQRAGGGLTTSGQPVMMTLTPAEQTAIKEIPDPRRILPDGSPNPDFGKPKPFTRTQELEFAGFTVLPNGQVVPSAQAGQGRGGGLGSGRYNNVPSTLRNNPPPPQTPPPPAPNAPAAPAIQQGGEPPPPPGGAPGPYTGGGIGSVLGPRSDAAPPANANVAAIMQGMQTARANPLGGSVMTAGPGAPTTPTTEATPEAGWGAAPGTYGTGPTPAARPAPIPTPAQRPATSPFDRPAVGFSPAEQKQIEAAGPKFDAETSAGTNAQGQQAILGNMLADTKQFTTGPQAGIVGKLRNLGIAMGIPGINVEGQSAKESFNKLAAGIAISQAQSVGAGSDTRFNVVTAANPHEELSPAGADLIIRQLQGNNDYLQARQTMAQQWPAKGDYNGFAQSIRELDPRVFQYERMQPDQKASWFKAMDKRDQTAFMAAHGWAESKGLIPAR